jgi:predicted Zn-dependent protease
VLQIPVPYGQVQIFVVDDIWVNNVSGNQRAIQTIANHELAHVLGYWGHSPIQNELMHAVATSMTSTRLSDNERRHLRQIYEAFRD